MGHHANIKIGPRALQEQFARERERNSIPIVARSPLAEAVEEVLLEEVRTGEAVTPVVSAA